MSRFAHGEKRAKSLLRKYAAEHALEASHNFDADHDVEKRFKEILEGRARRRAREWHPSYSVVPLSKLRLQRPPTTALAARLREHARLRFRRRKTVRLPACVYSAKCFLSHLLEPTERDPVLFAPATACGPSRGEDKPSTRRHRAYKLRRLQTTA